MFYVYRHIRSDTNLPFYVGKGQKTRAWSTKGRTTYWLNNAKYGYRVEIVSNFKDESDALEFEKKLILLYKSFGFCKANLADGGKGTSGFKLSKETKDKIRCKLLGTRLSEEHKSKLKLKRAGRTPTLGIKREIKSNLKTKYSCQKYEYETPRGIFKVSKDAAECFKVSYHTIIRWCKENKPGFRLIEL